jgi:hypothetical protein
MWSAGADDPGRADTHASSWMASRREIAFARSPAFVIGDGVVVAADRLPPAARKPASMGVLDERFKVDGEHGPVDQHRSHSTAMISPWAACSRKLAHLCSSADPTVNTAAAPWLRLRLEGDLR